MNTPINSSLDNRNLYFLITVVIVAALVIVTFDARMGHPNTTTVINITVTPMVMPSTSNSVAGALPSFSQFTKGLADPVQTTIAQASAQPVPAADTVTGFPAQRGQPAAAQLNGSPHLFLCAQLAADPDFTKLTETQKYMISDVCRQL